MSSPLLELELDKSVPTPATRRARYRLTARRMATVAIVAGLCGLIVPMPELPEFVSPFFHLAHIALFALLAWFLRARFAVTSWQHTFSSGALRGDLLILALGTLIGAGGELVQRWIPGRHSSIGDVGLDLVGLILGLAFHHICGARLRDPWHRSAVIADAAANEVRASAPADTPAAGSHARPRLSVVIPTFNRCRDVPRAIDSVLRQSDAMSLEVVVVDDGSTDGTSSALARRYGNDPSVRLLRMANSGVSAARNRGLAEAGGEFVLFLDSDDWLLPGTLELVALLFSTHAQLQFLFVEGRTAGRPGRPARMHVARSECPGWLRGDFTAGAAFQRERVDPGGEQAGPGATLAVGDFFPAIVRGGLFFLSGLFMRRQAALAAGWFNERYHLWEDWDFHARLCLRGLGGYIDHIGFCRDVGRGDQLSDAVNGLRFAAMHCRIVRGLDANGCVQLPRARRQLRVALADADYWMGRCLLRTRHRRLARRLLLRSLLRPHKPARSAVWLALSVLP